VSRALQSAMNAAPGSPAEVIERLGVILYVGAGVIFVVVIALAIYAAFAAGKPIAARRWVIGGGLVFPSVTLSVLLIYSLWVGDALDARGASGAPHAHTARDANAPLRVEIIGRQWWWEVRYHSNADEPIVAANELRIPVGTPVELLLSTADVIHSFWVPPLAGKVDMIPGRTTRLVVQSDEEGMYRGQCAEYCGGQHAWMALFVVAEPKERFAAWLEQQARGVTVPSDPFLKLGYDAFFKGGCDECHAVRGTRATSTAGPDLTHVGGRESLAAGMLKNHVGTMAGWIAGPQDVKPGNLMPSVDVYTGQELRAVSAWLKSLE
jgi:cytochrome c oxidase subunit II